MNAKEIVQNYKDVISPTKIAIIIARAKKNGLPEDMVEDVIQDVALEIINFNYDPEKSNGATETTALTAIIDHKIIDIVRRIEFEKNFWERESHTIEMEADELRPLQMSMDIQSALKALSPIERQICMKLINCMTINEIAQEEKWGYAKAKKIVAGIRSKLAGMNLKNYIDEK
ncbi:MAG: hypothetical protein A2Y10_02570 [Planctomycetes bacterium GWF2_41_51]|nr:MAG: hypothetical protein A2Y10_02570 [Planctomycetes bacterium GWF2_41_51]HBG25690.1 hypothetical protein [Phycisphaerales bacterium]